RRRWRWAAAALAVLLLGGIALGVYSWGPQARPGSVTVRAYEPELVVTIDGNLVSLSHVSSGVTNFTHATGVPLAPGLHHLKVFKDARQVYEETFTLAPGETKEIHIPRPQPPPSAEPSADDGWVRLFNGKDLTGWVVPQPGMGEWEIDPQGRLVGRGPRSYLFAQRADFADFHLRAELDAGGGSSGSIGFRCGLNRLPQQLPAGYRAQVSTDPGPGTLMMTVPEGDGAE